MDRKKVAKEYATIMFFMLNLIVFIIFFGSLGIKAVIDVFQEFRVITKFFITVIFITSEIFVFFAIMIVVEDKITEFESLKYVCKNLSHNYLKEIQLKKYEDEEYTHDTIVEDPQMMAKLNFQNNVMIFIKNSDDVEEFYEEMTPARFIKFYTIS